jgi:hypothetical protein
VKALNYACPLPSGSTASELALVVDRGRAKRLLIVPALFDEANRMRRFTVEVMRRLDGAGIDCFLPDLPGCNESLQDLAQQTSVDWSDAMQAAAGHFNATHLLAIRGGGLIMPGNLPCWNYGPIKGASILRQMLRARIISSREAGRAENQEKLLDAGQEGGLELGGFQLSAGMLRDLQALVPQESANIVVIEQELIGGSPLWLRAEPGEDRAQADALAAVIAMGLGA